MGTITLNDSQSPDGSSFGLRNSSPVGIMPWELVTQIAIVTGVIRPFRPEAR